MSEEHHNPVPDKVSCHVCHQEIPHADALSAEGQEYLFFFCGQGCYVQWNQEEAKARRESARNS